MGGRHAPRRDIVIAVGDIVNRTLFGVVGTWRRRVVVVVGRITVSEDVSAPVLVRSWRDIG